jgi:hypothetical protein
LGEDRLPAGLGQVAGADRSDIEARPRLEVETDLAGQPVGLPLPAGADFLDQIVKAVVIV